MPGSIKLFRLTLVEFRQLRLMLVYVIEYQTIFVKVSQFWSILVNVRRWSMLVDFGHSLSKLAEVRQFWSI